MKQFELMYLCGERFLSPLHGQARSYLAKLAKSHTGRLNLLDVGGRRSRYTIGIPADVTISDLPRETAIQHERALGLTQEMLAQIRRRRSNIREIIFDDMTRSQLPSQSFDCVVAVEVLEHIEEDALFVSHVHRILKPGGKFLMTTPNGDFLKIPHGDHKRHYTRTGLRSLLAACFGKVEVEYAIQTGRYRKLGRQPWSIKHPVQTAASMYGNLINSIQSAQPMLKEQSQGTLHLIASAAKQAYLSDKRDAVRHAKQLPLDVFTQNGTNGHRAIEGQSLNLSTQGIGFVVSERQERELKSLADNESLCLALNVPPGDNQPSSRIEMQIAPTRYESVNNGDAARGCLVATRIKEINSDNCSRLIHYLQSCYMPLVLLTVLFFAPLAPGAKTPHRNDLMEKDRSEESQRNYAAYSSRPVKRRAKPKVI